MLASAALVGCTDDVMENGASQQGDGTKAYLTLSFSANANGSSRSTADDAANKGDKDGDQEDSGHHNKGTAAENAIKTALVVVRSTSGTDGWAGFYSVITLTDGSEFDQDGKNKGEHLDGPNVFEAVGSNENKFYVAEKPIELPTGTYEVLVVANPYEGLYSDVATKVEVVAGINDASKVLALYDAVLEGNYASKENDNTAPYNYAGQIAKFEENTLQSVMMANKAMATVTLKAENTIDNPGVASVDIERVASKITFRPHTIAEVGAPNVYKVEVPLTTTVKAITETLADGTILNKATYEGKTIWVNINGETEAITVYEETEGGFVQAEGYENIDKDALVYHYDESNIEEKTWYVRLEKYALVNLSNKVYHVRHTQNTNKPVHFGTLTGSNFLVTPHWPEINEVKFDDKFNTTSMFWNTLADVSDESVNNATLENAQYFHELPKSDITSDQEGQEVENVENEDYYDQHKDDLQGIGHLLAYCLENTTDIEHQTHGLSTGISFMGKIYLDPACQTAIETLYSYAGRLYESIEAIQKAYDVTPKAEADGGKGLETLTESSSATELEAVGIFKYAGNTCYYYTTEIKHFDNGKPLEMGNMEFAIMRNNIYSLAVTGINVIGDPFVDPTPSTPDEVDKPKLVVEAEIMPWIVRYHDIEFK